MKFKRNKATDYQSSLFIGVLILFVGVGGLIVDSDNLTMHLINIVGAMIMFIQAFVRYRRKEQLFKGF